MTENELKLRRGLIEFVQFLKENDAYNSFLSIIYKSKLYKYGSVSPTKLWKNIDDRTSAMGQLRCILATSFTWWQTPQGHHYWSNLDKKWSDRLDIIESQI